MKKLFSFFAAMVVAVAVNAQGTDFAAPGYSCAADDAVLSGAPAEKLALIPDAGGNYVGWSDVGLSSYGDAKAAWTITATRGCYVTVTLDLAPVYPTSSSNAHIFQVKINDDKGNEKGTLAEPAENADASKEKQLEGTILIPAAGTYTVELQNKRNYGKGGVKKVILTYAADAPSEIIAVSKVELNKTALTLDLEEVELLAATVSPDNATDPSVTWESDNKAVATVSETGLVKAIAAGTANIKAKAGEKEAVCAVTVAAAAIPEVDFATPYVLSAKVAHLDGAVWKNDDYKIYGDGGHNKNYGTASWTINVTKPCVVSGVLNGVEGGHLFVLDLYDGEEKIGYIAHPSAKSWSNKEIALDSTEHNTLTFPKAGTYKLVLRNEQEWSSGKAAGVTLSLPVLPYMAIIGDMNAWAGTELVSKDGLTASCTINLAMNEKSGYGFKVLVGDKAYCIKPNPSWYGFHRDWTSASGIDYVATEADAFWLQIDKAGDYTFTWTIAEKKLDITFPAFKLENNYYLVGSFDGVSKWGVDALTAADMFEWNKKTGTGDNDEFKISATLKEGDQFKAAYVYNDNITDDNYFPKAANYVVGAEQAGKVTIYLRPAGDGGEGWHYGTLYIVKDATTAIDNTEAGMKAVKMIEKGQLVIIKNGVKYNAQGQVL